MSIWSSAKPNLDFTMSFRAFDHKASISSTSFFFFLQLLVQQHFLCTFKIAKSALELSTRRSRTTLKEPPPTLPSFPQNNSLRLCCQLEFGQLFRQKYLGERFEMSLLPCSCSLLCCVFHKLRPKFVSDAALSWESICQFFHNSLEKTFQLCFK